VCGIAGILDNATGHTLEQTVRRMADSLLHRGPDVGGVWADEAAGIAMGHRRLAVVDLSPAGHQPMCSACGRFVLAFNGEIYNHLQLRSELEMVGHEPAWRGHSDTETLLAGVTAWGLKQALQRCVGMFAIALWDKQTRTLTLARDRIGEKPLYYGWVGRDAGAAFVFGSELKAIKAYRGFAPPVCREALAQYLRFMYVPAPRSIYQGVFKLEPGCLLTVQGSPPPIPPAMPVRPGQNYGSVSVRRWWSLAAAVEAGAAEPLQDEAEALHLLEEQLQTAVNLQSLADVPLGAFLSGGVDSSMIVALMQRQSSRPVKTFTVGFEEAGFDESPYARAVARHLGTEHHEMRVSAQMTRDVIPDLPSMYDEPFADSSQIPTHLVCKAARQHVTVALSGDAGDELFGGYNRYFWGPRIWNRLAWMPLGARQAMVAAISRVPVAGWDNMIRPLNAVLPANKAISRAGDKAHKLARRLNSVHNLDDLYLSLVSEWQDPGQLVRPLGSDLVLEPGSLLNDALPARGLDASSLRMMYRDSMTYLPDDILCKVDRAAMAVSLETRVPFLDHRVVELAWRLPLHMKVRGNEGKWALRQVLYKYVPRELIERPKAGFAIPVGEWLRGPLREWAEALLDETRLQSEGYFHPPPIRRKWAEHLSGRYDHTPSLWAVLMFQAWLEKQQADALSLACT
jgi:asparagine synthase (glutamine-hydrolysing)